MKYLLVFGLILVWSESVTSKCSPEGEKTIGECFRAYEIALNDTLVAQEIDRHAVVKIVDDHICKPHNDYEKCLAKYSDDCLNPDVAKKVFGTSILLIYYWVLNYECNHQIEVPIKDVRCAAKLFSILEFDKKLQTCEDLKQYILTYKKKVIEKCGNPTYAEYRGNNLLFVLHKLIPTCKV